MQILPHVLDKYPMLQQVLDGYFLDRKVKRIVWEDNVGGDLRLVDAEANKLIWEFDVKSIHCDASGCIQGGCVATAFDVSSNLVIHVHDGKVQWEHFGVSTSLLVTRLKGMTAHQTARIECMLERVGKSLATIHIRMYDEKGELCYTGSHGKYRQDALMKTGSFLCGVGGGAVIYKTFQLKASPPSFRRSMSHRIIKEGSSRTGLIQGIEYNGWTITSKKAPICSSTEMDDIQKRFGMPPPEMVFGNNYVTLKHGDNTEIVFNAIDALSKVDTSSTSSERIKVAYAEEWKRKSDVKDVIKPYDWTYTTPYRGTTSSHRAFETAEEPEIDIARLQRKDPILFYDENILYEDELADNGTTVLSVRLRVMPSCFLVLQRLFLRVDDVLFRINDTRIYHTFGSPYVIREYMSREDHFNSIVNKLSSSDASLLNDTNWISSVLPTKPEVFIRERLPINE